MGKQEKAYFGRNYKTRCKLRKISKIIDTQYGNLTDSNAVVKSTTVAGTAKSAAMNADDLGTATSPKTDKFEYSTSESVLTYSPGTIKKQVNSANVAAVSSSVSHATTKAQKKMLPLLLAAINGKSETITIYSNEQKIS